MTSLHSALRQFIASISHINNENIYGETQKEEFNTKLHEDTLAYPAICFTEATEYLCHRNQNNIDLENGANAETGICIQICSKNIDDIICLEELFTNQLSSGYDLKNCSDIPEVENAHLSPCIEGSISRERKENNTFSTCMLFMCSDFFLPKEIENPIRFELDYKTQKKVLKHLSFLESLYHVLLEEYKKIESNESKELINTQILQLEKQISEMFIFKSMCNDSFTYKRHCFKSSYQLLTDKGPDADIKSIINLVEKQIEQEDEKNRRIAEEKAQKEKEAKEKEEKLKLHFSKNGDIQINRFTDAIIQDLQNNVSLNSIPVYGGTTFSKWYREYEEKSITYPNILITDSSRYHLDLKSYENETKDGNIITRKYDTSSFPIQYGIIVNIFSNSLEKNKEIESAITNYYAEKRTIKVPDYKNQNEYTVITVCHEANNEDKREQFGKIYKTLLSFYMSNTVYYISEYTPEECENNQRLQLRLLQQAQFVLIKSKHYGNALANLESLYKPFLEKRRQFFGIFNSKSYKTLLKQYINGMPIKKELFDAGMEPIVRTYPYLFQQFSTGVPYSQIESNIKGYENFYKERFNILIDLLKIPQSITKYNFDIDCRTQDAIVAYINKMLDPYCELSNAVEEYAEKSGAEKERERIERIERERQLEEERAMREEQGYYDDYSGGRSNGPSIFKIATGVALGNKLSNRGNKEKRNGKRDLLGSSVCQYGKRDKHGFKQTCSFCPVGDKCSRH